MNNEISHNEAKSTRIHRKPSQIQPKSSQPKIQPKSKSAQDSMLGPPRPPCPCRGLRGMPPNDPGLQWSPSMEFLACHPSQSRYSDLVIHSRWALKGFRRVNTL